MSVKATILSTRDIEPALLEEARLKGIEVVVSNFIKTELLDPSGIRDSIDKNCRDRATVIFTSMKAAEAVGLALDGCLPGWKIYCLGNGTRKVVENFEGNHFIADHADNAMDLAEKIVRTGKENQIVFFCGDIRRDEIPATLRDHGIALNELTVYKTICLPHRLEKEFDGILFFSPSGVESFFRHNKPAAKTVLFAIGEATAAAIKTKSANELIKASSAGKENLARRAIEYFTK